VNKQDVINILSSVSWKYLRLIRVEVFSVDLHSVGLWEGDDLRSFLEWINTMVGDYRYTLTIK
jgi:hypothetical protein